jgi:peptide/nickel transport system substrate-binding protein
VIDSPGPWGTGPFTLAEGFSSLRMEIGLIQADPFVCTWLPTGAPRSDRVVLEANATYWNTERGPRLARVVFRNDIDPAAALDLVCDSEGEVDIVCEVSPAAAARVAASDHAGLVAVDALRVLVGVVNRDAPPFDDLRARRALNLAVNRQQLIDEVFAGYAYPLAGMTPPYSRGRPAGQGPYPYDPDRAASLLRDAGMDRPLRLAATFDLEGPAQHLAEQYRRSLGVPIEVTVIPADQVLAAQHALVEKTLPLPFDVLVFAWFDLTSDIPPAVLHREFYHSTGAFRTGPPIPEFDELFGRYAAQTDQATLDELAADLDRLAYDQALSVFLCAPQALYAVNRNVAFTGYAATFELAETSAAANHWSRR